MRTWMQKPQAVQLSASGPLIGLRVQQQISPGSLGNAAATASGQYRSGDFSGVPVHAAVSPAWDNGGNLLPGLRRAALEAEADRMADDAVAGAGPQASQAALIAHFERRSGRDLGDVRVHRDAAAESLLAGADAQALAFGRDIFLGRRDTSKPDAWLLAHELQHTVQQAGMGAPVAQAKRAEKGPKPWGSVLGITPDDGRSWAYRLGTNPRELQTLKVTLSDGLPLPAEAAARVVNDLDSALRSAGINVHLEIVRPKDLKAPPEMAVMPQPKQMGDVSVGRTEREPREALYGRTRIDGTASYITEGMARSVGALQNTMMHELLHALGLGHNNEEGASTQMVEATVNALGTEQRDEKYRGVAASDLAGLKRLYGVEKKAGRR